MYILTSLQILQAHAKLSNISALMLIYKGKNGQTLKHDQIEDSIKNKGIWYWLKENTLPELFASLRIRACLDDELYLFDMYVPNEILNKDIQSNWKVTLISKDGTIQKNDTSRN